MRRAGHLCHAVLLSCKGNQEEELHNRLIAPLVLERPLDSPCNPAFPYDLGEQLYSISSNKEDHPFPGSFWRPSF